MFVMCLNKSLQGFIKSDRFSVDSRDILLQEVLVSINNDDLLFLPESKSYFLEIGGWVDTSLI